jgi:hypothetical protein
MTRDEEVHDGARRSRGARSERARSRTGRLDEKRPGTAHDWNEL